MRSLIIRLFLLFGLLFPVLATALDVTTYSPHATGNQWSYKNNNSDTETITMGSPVVLPSGITAIPETTVNSTETGYSISYGTYDSNGIRLHQGYTSSVFVTGYGNTSVTTTFSPALITAPINVTVGNTYTSSGTASGTYTNVTTVTLSYSSSYQIVGFETVTDYTGTQSWSALKIIKSATYSGTINGQFISKTSTSTTWFVDGIGKVQHYSPNASGIMETWKLTSTNVVPPKVNQTIGAINFSPTTFTVGGTTTASATTSSGLAVSFSSSTPGVCMVSGSAVTGITAGVCTITANQTGNASYSAATPVLQSITVEKTGQSIGAISFSPTINTTTASAAATSGLAVSFSSSTPSVCTVNGSMVTGIAVGICTIAANQAGNLNYNPATQVTQDITVSTSTPSAVGYTDNHDGTIYDSRTGLTWMRCSMGQTWNGNTCTGTATTYLGGQANAFTGTTVFAGQSDWHLPTLTELQSLINIAYFPYIDPIAFPNTPAWSFWSSSPNDNSFSPGYFVGYFAGASNYNYYWSNVRLVRAGQYFKFSLSTSPTTLTSQSVNAFGFSPTTLVVNGIITASATATSGLAVNFSSATPNVCTVSGSMVTGHAAGVCTIAANQAGNANYNAATQVTQSIIIASTDNPSAAGYTDNHDGTVTDPATGLMWMRCAMGQTWDGSTCTGTTNTYTWDQAIVLTSSFAGHSDWKLPNIRELQTILDRTRSNPTIDTMAFPNTSASYFWSASVSSSYSSYAWEVAVGNGIASSSDKSIMLPVRLVRVGQSLALLSDARPDTDYTDNGDGTVTHKPTGLMWKKCSEGQTGSTCTGTESLYSWDQAMALTSSFAGKSDWRVPTVDELVSLTDYTKYSPAINTTIFLGTPASYFWSASVYAVNSIGAWNVNFSNGDTSNGSKNGMFPIRLVRKTILNFMPSWNLVGNSVNASMTVAAAFGNATKVQSVWKWIPATSKWAFYSPSLAASGTLATYAASKGYEMLPTIDAGEGFWVNAKEGFTASLPAGTAVAATSFQEQPNSAQNKLLKGWNLIAMGDDVTPSAFSHGLSQGAIPLNVTTLWAWDASQSAWYFYAQNLEASGGLANYIATKNYRDFGTKTLDPTMGFWVNKP